MNSKNSCVTLRYRHQDEADTSDLNVEVTGDNVDEVKLMRLLTTFLEAIGSRVTLNL